MNDRGSPTGAPPLAGAAPHPVVTAARGLARGPRLEPAPRPQAGTAADLPQGATLAEGRRARLIAAAALLGLGVLAALLLIVPGTVGGYDGQSMLGVTRAIVERHNVTVHDPLIGVPGLGGRLYSKFGVGQSVAALPLYLAGRALAPLVPASYAPEAPAFAASFLPALVTALTTTLLVLAAVELGASVRAALLLGLVYALATPAAVYPTQWFSEPLTACGLLATVYLLLRDRCRPTLWRPLLAGTALGVAVSTRLEALLFAPPLVLYALLPGARRQFPPSPEPLRSPRSPGFPEPAPLPAMRLAALLLPLGAALGGIGLYDMARFGSPLQTGYSEGLGTAMRDTHPPHSLASFAEGLYGLLVSPGKGLFEYAPPALLAPLGAIAGWMRPRRGRAEILLLVSLILIDLAGHANVLIRWLGGWSWGPRFLMSVLPLVLLLLAPLLGAAARRARAVRCSLAVLAVLGVLVQAPALFVYEPHTYIYRLQATHRPASAPRGEFGDITGLENDYVNQPAFSPILGSWQQLGIAATWTPPPARRLSPARLADGSVTVAPHTWWRLLTLQGVPAGPVAAICALLLALAAVLLRAAFATGARYAAMSA